MLIKVLKVLNHRPLYTWSKFSEFYLAKKIVCDVLIASHKVGKLKGFKVFK